MRLLANKKLIAVIAAVLVLAITVVVVLLVNRNKAPAPVATNTTATTVPTETLLPFEEGGDPSFLTLNIGGTVDIGYDIDGKVLNVEGIGDHGGELAKETDTAVGKPCQEIVSVLTKKAADLGYIDGGTKMIVVKTSVGAYLPTEDFLSECVDAVKAQAQGITIMLMAEKDLNSNGYICLESCQVLLKNYLNLSGDVSFNGPTNPSGSKYYLSTKYQENTVYYTVDAYDGTIKKCSKKDFETISELGFLPEEIEQGNTFEGEVDPEYTFTVE